MPPRDGSIGLILKIVSSDIPSYQNLMLEKQRSLHARLRQDDEVRKSSDSSAKLKLGLSMLRKPECPEPERRGNGIIMYAGASSGDSLYWLRRFGEAITLIGSAAKAGNEEARDALRELFLDKADNYICNKQNSDDGDFPSGSC